MAELRAIERIIDSMLPPRYVDPNRPTAEAQLKKDLGEEHIYCAEITGTFLVELPPNYTDTELEEFFRDLSAHPNYWVHHGTVWLESGNWLTNDSEIGWKWTLIKIPEIPEKWREPTVKSANFR